ncbi:5-oxoprolinase subunit C family protein [Nocardia callitridis]|uniref:Biotin-dependent carboxyltransferase family protein n=1 Tax=Nocardia callitridis TaxID=648753 RepID=A0ABP9JZ73_9NOCA
MISVEQVGPLATIQDRGRPGWFDSGVGPSGAADLASLGLGNRLVGNPEDAAGIEVLLGGLVLRALRDVLVAVTGAPMQATIDGIPVGHASVLELAAGQVLRLAAAPVGLRGYVAVRGGIAVPPTLGSRSTDTLSGLGPDPLRPGDQLPVGRAPSTYPTVDLAPVPELPADRVEVRALLGPRDAWFEHAAALFEGDWVISADTDRVGARLDRRRGPPLARARHGELTTEGMALGSIQVPPSGQPVVFLADHPITGGYPVVGVVLTADVPAIAQARPGQHLRFRPAVFGT